MRTTNNLGGDSQEKRSVKVSNAPGGKSNFSLGWGSDEVEAKPSKKQFSNQNQQSYNIFGDNTAEKTSVKVNQKPGGNSSIVLGSEKSQFEENKYESSAPLKNYGYQQDKSNYKQQPEEKQQVHTSVKVHNPPGGRSQITFG